MTCVQVTSTMPHINHQISLDFAKNGKKCSGCQIIIFTTHKKLKFAARAYIIIPNPL